MKQVDCGPVGRQTQMKEVLLTPPSKPVDGLPLVTPPSGRFIAQLFLVPGIIVLGAITVLWGFTWLVGASRTPEQFLKELSSPNLEVRRRAASDLSQILRKDPALASNPRFGLDLADLLADALHESDKAEKHAAEERDGRTAAKSESDRETLEGQKRYVQFLISCLGSCNLPVGVSLLCDIAARENGPDPETTLLWRGVALWALANLGDRLNHVDGLPEAQRQEVMHALDAEAAGAASQRSRRAEQTRKYLAARFSGHPDSMGVEGTLERCAQARDPGIRKLAAFVLNFWEGDPKADHQMEETLLALSYDDGHGATDGNERSYGFEVRYKAVEGLARRGSTLLSKRIGALEDMLDLDQLAKQFRVRFDDGRDVPDDTAIVSTVTGALRAISEFHRRQPTVDLSRLGASIEKLVNSPNPAVRAEAERTQIALRTA
jgi:hypothetical protein